MGSVGAGGSALKITVLQFLSERFADFFDKYALRSQIVTKSELTLQIIVKNDMI